MLSKLVWIELFLVNSVKRVFVPLKSLLMQTFQWFAQEKITRYFRFSKTIDALNLTNNRSSTVLKQHYRCTSVYYQYLFRSPTMSDNSKLSGFILTINMTIDKIKKAQTVPAQFISFKSKKYLIHYLLFYFLTVNLKTVIRPLK